MFYQLVFCLFQFSNQSFVQESMNRNSWVVSTIIYLFLQTTHAYLDISINITRERDMVAYNLPIEINNLNYAFGISYGGKISQQNFLSPKTKVLKDSKAKHKKVKIKNNDHGDMIGKIEATSLEGYSFQGWKRFFMEAFMYISQRYYHELNLNLNSIKQIKNESAKDGVIKFSPTQDNNQIYRQIKKNTEYINEDYVALYRGINDKHARMQLGGYEENFARGHKTGVLFYIVSLQVSDDKWMVPISSISIIREKNNHDDEFHLSSSKINLSLDIQTPYLTLPKSMSAEVERSVETEHTSCTIKTIEQENHEEKIEYEILFCSNISSVDLSLNLVKLSIDSEAHINISLYDLRRDYKQETSTTSFYIRFTEDEDEWTIGQSIFKSSYVVLELSNKLMMFSPINRFPQESYGVYIIRAIVGFIVFLIVAGFGAMIWQTFNDPFRKNKFEYGQDGIRLVSYEAPNQQGD